MRPLLAALALVLVTGCAGDDVPPTPIEELDSKLPEAAGYNVLVVSFDALRADALGTYGAEGDISPNIDAVAAESLVFDNGYSVAPVTPTSFAAAFTGMLPTRVFHAWKLEVTDTLAQRFADAGYETAAILNNVQLSAERHFDAGFDHFQTLRSRPDREVLDSAVAWLDQPRNDPFFAWVHFLSPHSPYTRRAESEHLYDPDYEGPYVDTSGQPFAPEDPKDIERLWQLYLGEVYAVDRLFGELVDDLRTRGLLDRTILVITSDHGEEFGEHGGFQHDRLTEEHVHIPMIVRHPATVGTPVRSPILTSNVDFKPSLLALAGIEFDGQGDGRNWRGLTAAPELVVGVSMTGGKERWLSLRQGPDKLIQTCIPDSQQRLFDLDSDPGEQADIASAEERRVRELYRDLGVILGGEPCRVMQNAVQGKNVTAGMTDEDIEALKSLGYLN
ncbi:MAG: sulfatase [Acidobacteriota bacterium]